MRQLRYLCLCAFVVLGACTAIPVEPLPEGLSGQPPADWVERHARLESFQYWQLTGKLAVRQPSDSGTALISEWTQKGEAYNLELSSSFLGMGRTRLNGVPGFIELTLPNGNQYQSGDPEALIEAATGWQLPINSLVWWVRGLPGPDGDVRLFFDRQGRLALIRQQGWEIRYDRWRTFIPDYPPLPARLTAIKGEKRVRLAITNWEELDGGSR